MTNENGILIFGELNSNYGIKPVVKELVTKARSLKEKMNNEQISVCIIGPKIEYSEIISDVEQYGVDNIIICCNENLNEYEKNHTPEIFVQIAKKYLPKIILIGATENGKEIASYTATKLETGLTADCTNLDIKDSNKLLSTRPTFGGQLTADILCKTYPQMATVQANIFKAMKIENQSKVIFEDVNIAQVKNIEVIEKTEKKQENKDVTTAKIIVAGGKGACSKDGFKMIRQLATKLNGVVAGSREAFEHGYITKSQQIGQTGKTVMPELYIAVGISGANQHLTAIKNSGKIIAINKDRNAPIFKQADIGIVGDLFEVLPDLIKNFDTVNKEENNE